MESLKGSEIGAPFPITSFGFGVYAGCPIS